MTNTISRFLATPSNVFELKLEQDHENITMQKSAIIRLAQCVQTKPAPQMRQAAVSTLYALLNEITRYSDEEGSDQVNGNSIVGAPDADMLSDSQKQQVVVNVLSAIVNVAVYLADETVSKYFIHPLFA